MSCVFVRKQRETVSSHALQTRDSCRDVDVSGVSSCSKSSTFDHFTFSVTVCLCSSSDSFSSAMFQDTSSRLPHITLRFLARAQGSTLPRRSAGLQRERSSTSGEEMAKWRQWSASDADKRRAFETHQELGHTSSEKRLESGWQRRKRSTGGKLDSELKARGRAISNKSRGARQWRYGEHADLRKLMQDWSGETSAMSRGDAILIEEMPLELGAKLSHDLRAPSATPPPAAIEGTRINRTEPPPPLQTRYPKTPTIQSCTS